MNHDLTEKFRARFGRLPAFVAHAPGRIEFIGNHTDYNGGTVLGASIDRRVLVAVGANTADKWNFASDTKDKIVSSPSGVLPGKKHGDASWANYPLGVLAALPEFGLRMPGGFDFLASSNLPSGAGLSSSAALELASALTFLALSGQDASLETVVKLCRHAENHFVGVPCGILDQGVSGFGRKDHLVFIDCRIPAFSTVALPADARFWIFNTHTKHALVDGLYAERHRECMAAAQGLGVRWLADTTPAEVDAAKAKLPPAVFRRAKHIVEEISRVDATVVALRRGDLTEVGRLLTASHRSSQSLFENSTPELDFLVDRLVSTNHVHGARLTGGGFGGAVMALTSPAFSEADAHSIAQAYEQEFGRSPDVLTARTGDGAALD